MSKRTSGKKVSAAKSTALESKMNELHLNRNRKMYRGLPEEKNRMSTKEVWSNEKAERAGRRDAKITREHHLYG